jgi:putative component of toxin-antitoxin plasmid stabilization module
MVDNLLSKVNISAMKTILTTDKYEAWFNGLKDSMANTNLPSNIE